MERALDLDLLRDALGDRLNLPTPEELQDLMAQMELQLFLRESRLPEGLLESAWYLHAVASVSQARERYSLHRQRQAFTVSAHIFDLALHQVNWSRADRLSLGFAAAIGYRRGGRDPNATAIMHRLRSDIQTEVSILEHLDTVTLEAGLALLGFETRTLFKWFAAWRRQFGQLAELSELPDLVTTLLGPAQLTVLGAEDLLTYLAHGVDSRLGRGVERLRQVAVGGAGPDDLNARWVAAHLLNLSGEAHAGSLWNPLVMPPDVPRSVRQAFTLGRPPVLTLWEPQRELLAGPRSPFAPSVRRIVMAVPTSGGKTLLGQLISIEHLARTNQSVCYVVPTRSLGREVRRAMSDRLRMLNREAPPEPPDFPDLAELLVSIDEPGEPEVVVMTPERLAHSLRHDAPGVLDRFGLFVFDEAQLIKESGRGFILESTIGLIDHLTHSTAHRIALISAAMGNVGAVAQWLDPDGGSLSYESQWRGPRRLHAAFTATADWTTTTVETAPRARQWPYRLVTELSGLIRLRMANGRTAELYMNDTGWQLVRKSTSNSAHQSGIPKDDSRSTKQYRIASDMITALGHAGSVLVVAPTRNQAQMIAGGIADLLDEDPALAPLVEFVRLQLGDSHPLVPLLRRGVAFHHAGLPVEVLESLENAIRDESLRYLTCTSTLTEGVNLPVRTVVIYDQQYEDLPTDARLRGARLVNAMGRAGRAGRETEGWIVLVRAAEPGEQDFHDLDPDALELTVKSTMASDLALEAFAQFEERQRADADAVFENVDPIVDSFISFVWEFLALEEQAGTDPAGVNLAAVVDSTLAAAQSSVARQRLMTLASSVREAYVRSDPAARRRWHRTGTSVASARALDRLARRVAVQLAERAARGSIGDLHDPVYVARILRQIVGTLLELREAPRWTFHRTKRRDPIDVDVAALLSSWLDGTSIQLLADQALGEVPDPSWRIEQMVDAVTSLFEHYLSWTLAALVELVNLALDDQTAELQLCPDLGAYVRYGVSDPAALVLMRSGVRSRRLANLIAEALPAELDATAAELRVWLGEQSVGEWRHRFGATASELLDLLDFTRERGRSLLKDLLEQGSVTVDLGPSTLPATAPLTLEARRNDDAPAPLAVYAGDVELATVSARDQADVDAILATGLELALRIEVIDSIRRLVISGTTPADLDAGL